MKAKAGIAGPILGRLLWLILTGESALCFGQSLTTGAPVSCNAPTGRPIAACGAIDQSGEYYLSNDLSSPGTCLTFSTTSPVVLDLNCHTITYGTSKQESAPVIAETYARSAPSDLSKACDFTYSHSINRRDTVNRFISVTRISNTRTGPNEYVAGQDYNLHLGHGSEEKSGICWTAKGKAPPAGAAYYVDYTYMTPVFGIYLQSATPIVEIRNGTLIEGQGTYGFSHAIHATNLDKSYTEAAFHDLTFRLRGISSAAIHNQYGVGFHVSNIRIINSSTSVYSRDRQEGFGYINTSPSYWFDKGRPQPSLFENNSIESSPQGGITVMNGNTTIRGNYCRLTATTSNDFCIQVSGKNELVYNNHMDITGDASGRGIHLDFGATNAEAYGNDGTVQELERNTEYGGCEEQGTFFLQVEDAGGVFIHDNHGEAVAQALGSKCPASALRVTDTANDHLLRSLHNVWTAKCMGGCPMRLLPPNTAGATRFAAAFSTGGASGPIVSDSDTFNTDDIAFNIDYDGAANIKVLNCIVNKTGDRFYLVAAGPGNRDSQITFQDCTWGAGIDPFHDFVVHTYARTFRYGVQWTYVVQLKDEGNAPAGYAQLSLRDAVGTVYITTADAQGMATIVLPQFTRAWSQKSEMNTIVNTPYTISVMKEGCRTQQYTLNIQGTTRETRSLGGTCH